MLELLLLAQAALNLYQWEPATGPVFGYHVYVDGVRVQTVYENQAWLDISSGQTVEVSAIDESYQEGPVGPPSEAHAAAASCVLRDEPACLADLNGDGFVSWPDVSIGQSLFGSECSCPGDMNGDGRVGFVDTQLINDQFGSVCE